MLSLSPSAGGNSAAAARNGDAMSCWMPSLAWMAALRSGARVMSSMVIKKLTMMPCMQAFKGSWDEKKVFKKDPFEMSIRY